MIPTGNLLRLAGIALALVALVGASLFLPWGAPAQAQAVVPSTPTNLELELFSGNDTDGYVAVLKWNYDDADDGYLLEKRLDVGGEWICVVAGGYPDGDTISISTLRDGRLTPAGEWYFRVYSINEQTFSYIDEVTCDENAAYGYVRDPDDDEGYTFSAAAEVGPFTFSDPAEATVASLDTPTNFKVDSARHGRVRLAWDLPDDNGRTIGYILKREYLGTGGVNQCIFWPKSLWTGFTDRFVSAYDTANDANKYLYRLYPISEEYERLNSNGDLVCESEDPESTPAEATATLTTSSTIGVVNGKLAHLNPGAPQNFRYYAYFSNLSGVGSKVVVAWNVVRQIPAYQLRYKDDDPMSDWTVVTLDSMHFPQMWGALGRGDYVQPANYWVSPDAELTGGTTYTFQVGSCDNTDCDNVTWSDAEEIEAAPDPS
ncbi:MAG: hypothetical protein OXE17_01745 [Chloroflexi bacterium]|nr:hypothetical protein [Chloroflexota bacterium]